MKIKPPTGIPATSFVTVNDSKQVSAAATGAVGNEIRGEEIVEISSDVLTASRAKAVASVSERGDTDDLPDPVETSAAIIKKELNALIVQKSAPNGD